MHDSPVGDGQRIVIGFDERQSRRNDDLHDHSKQSSY
jgi:hypothetical protein